MPRRRPPAPARRPPARPAPRAARQPPRLVVVLRVEVDDRIHIWSVGVNRFTPWCDVRHPPRRAVFRLTEADHLATDKGFRAVLLSSPTPAGQILPGRRA